MSSSSALVTPLSTSTIHCADSASCQSKVDWPLFLGPLDQLVYPTVPIAVVYVYRARPTGQEDTIPVPRLKRALAALLDFYPHLVGRLHIDDATGVRRLEGANTNGAHFVEASCGARLDARRVRLSDLPGEGNALLPPFEASLPAVCAGPLLTVQHTRFACGGVALGVRTLHTIMDADGFFALVRDLAEVYRSGSGSGTLAHPPQLAPYLGEAMRPRGRGGMSDQERDEAARFEPPLHHLKTEEEVTPEYAADKSGAAERPPVVGRVVRYSSADLGALKAHAADPSAQDADADAWVSTFDALAAHIWQRTYCARLRLHGGESNDDADPSSTLSSSLLTSVNYRARLSLPPRTPFNCLMTPYAALPHRTLAAAPLHSLAAAVHALTRSVSAGDAAKTARWVAAQAQAHGGGDVRRIAWGFDARQGATMVSAWNKFDVYGPATALDVDAGEGEDEEEQPGPALVAPPFTAVSLVDGLAYPMPAGEPRDPAGIDLYIALSEPVWEELQRDAEWTRFGRSG